MNRPGKLLLLLLLLLGTAAAVAAATLIWLFGTSSGARTVLDLASRFTPLSIEVRELEGSLARDLRLDGVRLTMPEKKITADRLRLQWRPMELLNRRLVVNELSVAGVEVIDSSPPSTEPPRVTWPTVPRPLARWEARIDLLQVDGLTYRRPEQPPVTINRFAAAATWHAGVLALNGLTIDSPSGNIRGRLLAGLIRPSLTTDLRAKLPQPVGGMNTFSLTTRLVPGKDPGEIVAGAVGFAGSGEGNLQITANVGIEPTALIIKELQANIPGRPGDLTATGTVRLTSDQPIFDLVLSLTGVDLKKETGTSTDLSGRISIAGTAKKYSGDFSITNRGPAWRGGSITADFAGTDAGIDLHRLEGSLIGGTIMGRISVNWQDGIALKAALQGKGIDPSTIDRKWHGSINADVTGKLVRSKSGKVSGYLTGALGDSIFQGWPLDGEVDAQFSGQNVRIRQLTLYGEGFRIAASGELSRRIDFSARITDLARILPEYAGEASAEGWVNWRGEGLPDGFANVTGTCLRAPGARLASGGLAVAINGGKDLRSTSFNIQAMLDGIRYRGFRADTAAFHLAGTMSGHSITASFTSPEASVRLTARGEYADEEWRGTLLELAGHDKGGEWKNAAPSQVSVSPTRVTVSNLTLEGTGTERLIVSADARLSPLRGTIVAEWHDLALDRANPWLEGVQLTGRTSGSVAMATTPAKRFTLAGNIAASGHLSLENRRIAVHTLALDLNWLETGLTGNILLDLGSFGTVGGEITSPSPPVFAVPTAGEADLHWKGVDLAVLEPWLPSPIDLTGRLGGRVTARLLPGRKFDMVGKATVENGVWTVENAGNTITTSIRELDASWSWRDEGLHGGLIIELGKWGKARATVAVPFPATIPFAPAKDIPLQAHATGRIQELGLFAAFFPGLVQDVTGQVVFDLNLAGTASQPAIDGTFELAGASGYIPAAGIRISDSRLHASFSRDRITIDTMRVTSGPGYLDGQAVLELREGRLTAYRGTIGGKDFEALDLPELHGLVSPRLELEGTPDTLTVRGEVLVPELQVRGEAPQAPVQPSEDVIIVDAPQEEKERGLTVRLDVGITLGERVTVKMKGIDAQLKGSVRLSGSPTDMTSRGEIHVVKGRYKAYGIDLDIDRGRIFYAGVALDRPAIDIVALKTVGEVKAGVTVGGTLQRPVVQLYSEPPMPDVDILAYIILGHPLGQSGEQATLVARAAGALLSAGQSVALQDQLKSRLGLSTLEVQTGQEDQGYMGYKPIAVGPAGTGTTAGGEIAETTVMLGKYLTRKLYISYGRSIFTGVNIFRLRYDFSRQFQLETQAGAESGIDLYYKVRFD